MEIGKQNGHSLNEKGKENAGKILTNIRKWLL
jgi:hypothetical protein